MYWLILASMYCLVCLPLQSSLPLCPEPRDTISTFNHNFPHIPASTHCSCRASSPSGLSRHRTPSALSGMRLRGLRKLEQVIRLACGSHATKRVLERTLLDLHAAQMPQKVSFC
eukprot:1156938-Pelagomonas_calceolata.AAC.1